MKDQDICIVSKRIRERRKKLGLTQAALAEKLGVNTKTVVTIEQMTIPTFATDRFISLCSILDCSPDYLMGIDDLPHRETTDIQKAIGFSEDDIRFLIGINDYRKRLERDGHERGNPYAANRAADYGLIIKFIGYFIRNMDFDIMIRHIKSMAKSEMFRGLAASFSEKTDDEKIEAALKNKTYEDKLFLMELVEEAEKLTNNAVSNNDAADASAFRFSTMATVVLDNFSKEHLPIARKLVEREVNRK